MERLKSEQKAFDLPAEQFVARYRSQRMRILAPRYADWWSAPRQRGKRSHG